MASENAETAAKAMERAVNQFGGQEDAEYIVQHLCSMHRTLNQSFVSRIILPFVRQMAMHYDTGCCDARNESACKACFLMWEALKAEYGIEDGADFSLPMV